MAKRTEYEEAILVVIARFNREGISFKNAIRRALNDPAKVIDRGGEQYLTDWQADAIVAMLAPEGRYDGG